MISMQLIDQKIGWSKYDEYDELKALEISTLEN